MELNDKIKKTVTRYFKDQKSVLAVYLLGSAARNEIRQESDIDLAVMMTPGVFLLTLEKAGIAGSLSYQLKRTVDLGVISSRNLVYSSEALLTGFPVFERDPEKVSFIRSSLLGLYIQFNHDRREVLDAYKA